MLIDYLHETMQSGGWVMFPIFITGALGFFLVGLVALELRGDIFQRPYDKFFNRIFTLLREGNTTQVMALLEKTHGMVSKSLKLAVENQSLSETALRHLMTEKLSRNIYLLDRHLPLITVLAAVAPLLGLLGTVTGMVHTFQVITEYGSSNPVLMAGGISEALITTQSGLIIAFPLVLFKHQLEDRITWMSRQVELGLTRYINFRYHAMDSGFSRRK